MELTADYIKNLEFICVKKKYYLCEQMDGCLERIGEEAERLQTELVEAKSKAAKYDMFSESLSETLFMAQKKADELKQTSKAESERLLAETREKCTAMLAEAAEERRRLLAENSEIAEATAKLRRTLRDYAEEIDAKLENMTCACTAGKSNGD